MLLRGTVGKIVREQTNQKKSGEGTEKNTRLLTDLRKAKYCLCVRTNDGGQINRKKGLHTFGINCQALPRIKGVVKTGNLSHPLYPMMFIVVGTMTILGFILGF